MDKNENQPNANRGLVYILGLVLIVAALTALIVAHNNSKDHNNTQTAAQARANTEQVKTSKACQIFTLADAKQVLGANAKGGEGTNKSESSDMDLSVCIYTQNSGNNTATTSKKVGSLLVRMPKTAAGIQSNQNQFTHLKPVDAVAVDGYGDGAYWDVQLAQLHILKNSNWYIITVGSPVSSTRTLDEAKQLADLLINKM